MNYTTQSLLLPAARASWSKINSITFDDATFLNTDQLYLLYVFVSYGFVFFARTRYFLPGIAPPSYLGRRTTTLLITHILVGYAEVFRHAVSTATPPLSPLRPVLAAVGLYHETRAPGGAPVPGALDLALCLTQSATCLAMAAPGARRRGDRVLTAPSYRAAAAVRIATGALAYARADPRLYRASVVLLNASVYSIAILLVLQRLGRGRRLPGGLEKYSQAWAASVWLAGFCAVVEGGLGAPVLVWNGTVLGFMCVDKLFGI